MSLRNSHLLEKLKKVDNLEIIKRTADLKRLSKDFYNYSPILEKRLDGCIADLVVRPFDQ